jgi:hypothetical protein
MKKAVPVTQNALYSCFALFLADLYSVDAFCCIQEVVFLFLTHIYKYVLYELMLPIRHVPTQIYVNKTYFPRIPFSLKKDEKLHIWFSLLNFLSKTSDVIKK